MGSISAYLLLIQSPPLGISPASVPLPSVSLQFQSPPLGISPTQAAGLWPAAGKNLSKHKLYDISN